MMNQSIAELRRFAKHIIACTLFVLLLVGGSAAAISLLAAGVSSLATYDTGSGSTHQIRSFAQTSQQGQGQASNQQGQETSQPVQAPNDNLTNDELTNVNATTVEGQWEYDIDHMHSPVGDAVDNGGVYLGQTIGTVVGNALKNLLQALFLEQNDGPVTSSTSAPSAQTGGVNG